VLLPEGGFGVTFQILLKYAAFYNRTSRFVAWLGVFPSTPGHVVVYFILVIVPVVGRDGFENCSKGVSAERGLWGNGSSKGFDLPPLELPLR
jgi:hypothetical protein